MNNYADMSASQQYEAFSSAQESYVQAQGRLDIAVKAGDEAGIFKARQDMEKQTRIMAAISNISESIHNLFMRLIDKLAIRA